MTVKTFRIKCSKCGAYHEMETKTDSAMQTVRVGWRSFGDALYCPECAKMVEKIESQFVTIRRLIEVIIREEQR